MAEARLTCLSPDHAAAVVTEATRPGDTVHTVRQDGDVVVIGYQDLRWPMDVAEWAHENGHAHDDDAAAVIAAAADRASGHAQAPEAARPGPVKVADDLFDAAFGWRPGGTSRA